jgi:hypothetical protein
LYIEKIRRISSETIKKMARTCLVCSQFLSATPASAAIIGPEDTIKSTPTEEQPPATPEDQGSQPSETPQEPTPAPKPEDPAPVEPPKEEVKPSSTPQPDQSTDQEATSELVHPAPIENQSPTLPELAENTPVESNQSTAIEITPVKETWDFIKEIDEDVRKIGLEEDFYG